MNHPKPEEWVPYLYGELQTDTRRHLKSHLQNCADCRAELARWQRSLHRLDSWKLPRARSAAELFVPAFKWAALAFVVLVVGFGLGRFTGAAAVAARVRAQLEPQVRQALRQEVAQVVRDEVTRASATLLQDSRDQTDKLLTAYTVNAARIETLENSCVALKRQLDTVAVNTEKGFVQLATYTPRTQNTSPQ